MNEHQRALIRQTIEALEKEPPENAPLYEMVSDYELSTYKALASLRQLLEQPAPVQDVSLIDEGKTATQRPWVGLTDEEQHMKDWIKELCPEIADWQAELIAEAAQDRVEAEREACAKLLDEMAAQDKRTNYYQAAANAIRARSYE